MVTVLILLRADGGAASARIVCKKEFVGGLGSNPFLSSAWISDKQGFVSGRPSNPLLIANPCRWGNGICVDW